MPSLSARASPAVAVAALFVFAGCLGGDAVDNAGTDPGTGTPSPTGSTGPSATDTPTGTPGPNGTATPTNTTDDPGNGTGDPDDPDDALPPIDWPELGAARVRPGVQVIVDGSQCTSNFIFRSPLNNTVYLGLAAHCVWGGGIGADAGVRDLSGAGAFVGKVVYSSWDSIGFETTANAAGSPADVHPHDFALIEIPAEKLDIVHPAVMYYGGPTALGNLSTVNRGDRLLVHGNTNLRPGPQALDEQEGVVLRTIATTVDGSPGTGIRAFVALPPLPGDSGSGLMSKEGEALGALSVIAVGIDTAGLSPVWWEYSSVPDAVAYLAAIGWPLELQTWTLLNDGNLP